MPAAVVRTVATCCALSWLTFPGFGLPDLAVTWDPDWPVALEAGWGLFTTVLVAAAFGGVAVRPRDSAPALVQLAVVTGALAVSAAVGGKPAAWLLAGLLAAETAAVAALARPARRGVRPAVALPWAVVAVAGVVPWTAYALAMARAAREGAPADVTVGVDHATVQGALALSLAALALVAAAWPAGRRFLGIPTGLTAAYLGLVSLAWKGAVGGLSLPWSVLALIWGAAVALLALTEQRRTRSQPWPVSRARTSSGHGTARPSETHT